MPLRVGRRQRHRGDREKDEYEPKGWDAIEGHMLTHDEGMISDFADDIDTLLVFAGLFSAVVTAFVIESYQALQPDNSQLFSLKFYLIQSTSSSDFRASPPAITINTLWFMSLVFSLDAALFCILTKQWCREYLKWNSVLAPARENLLVRQTRYEAWERWKIPAFIAAIPALLEFALVCFLSGAVVFIWTLQNTVAVILTIVIGLSHAAAFVVTVLPTFSPHCPYRSPTGWAITRMWYLLLCCYRVTLRQGHVLFRRCCIFLRSVRAGLQSGHPGDDPPYTEGKRSGDDPSEDFRLPLIDRVQDWRQRDLYVVNNSESRVPESQWFHRVMWPTDWHGVVRDSVQVSTLVRALSWVRRGSDEPRLLKNITECVEDLHTERFEARDPLARSISSVLVLHLNASGSATDFDITKRVFESTICRISDMPSENPAVSYIFAAYASHAVDGARGPFMNSPGTLKRINSDLIGPAPVDPWIIRHLLLRDLHQLLTDWMTYDCRTSWHVEIAVMILCHFRTFDFCSSTMHDLDQLRAREDFTNTLVVIYNELISVEHACKWGVVSAIADILCMMAKVTVHNSRYRITAHVYPSQASPSCYVNNFAAFALQVYDHNPGYSESIGCHLFVVAADAVLRSIYCGYVDSQPSLSVIYRDVHEVFVRMVQAVQTSLQRSYRNCGGNVDLPWLFTLVEIFRQAEKYRRTKRMTTSATSSLCQWTSPEFLDGPDQTVVFFQLLALLQQSLKMELITGDKTEEQFNELLRLMGNPELPAAEYGIVYDVPYIGLPEVKRDTEDSSTLPPTVLDRKVRRPPLSSRK